jgi:cell division protein FtsL
VASRALYDSDDHAFHLNTILSHLMSNERKILILFFFHLFLSASGLVACDFEVLIGIRMGGAALF